MNAADVESSAPVQDAGMADAPPPAGTADAPPPASPPAPKPKVVMSKRETEVGRTLYCASTHSPTRPKDDWDFMLVFANGDLRNVNFPNYRKGIAFWFSPEEYKSLTDQLTEVIEESLFNKAQGRSKAMGMMPSSLLKPGSCFTCMAAAAVPLCVCTCGICFCPLYCLVKSKSNEINKAAEAFEKADTASDCIEAMKKILKKFDKDGRLSLHGSRTWQQDEKKGVCRDADDGRGSLFPPKGWYITCTGNPKEIGEAGEASTYVPPPDPFAEPPAAASM